jgi:hypothetical protein
MNDKDLFDKAAGLSGPVILVAFLGGAAGGIIRWISLQESWKTGLATIVASCLMAGFSTPALSPYVAAQLEQPLLAVTSLLAILIGIVSLTLSNVLIRFAKSQHFMLLLSDIVRSVASAILTRGGFTVQPPPPPPPTDDTEGRP